MGIISPTLPELNGPRGSEEADVRNALSALLDLVNGNLSDANVDAAAAILGSKLDTTDGRLQQTTGLVVASAGLSLTTDWVDVPGASVTLTPDVACYAIITAAVNINIVRADAGVEGRVRLVVDGVEHGGGSDWAKLGLDWFTNVDSDDLSLNAIVSQVWRVPLTAAEHVLKLQAKKSSLNDDVDMGSSTRSRFMYQLVAQ